MGKAETTCFHGASMKVENSRNTYTTGDYGYKGGSRAGHGGQDLPGDLPPI